ncbi:hypothetical protein NGC36_09345 [Serratia rubidaea]|uniref:hypothetical protein n=1 Tax=Serratia rubidaea TaxID=61652 RepID=UPI002DBC3478|nr:hypothetical protein [Serratia rubidaea]MEB7585485.1 hypothetical protein [Serratia rubidaea]
MLKESITPLLAEHYFDLLSSSYRQRNRLFSSYQHGYSELIDWDTYIINYLQGLLLTADDTNEYIQDRISESVLSKGDLFAIALYALAFNLDDYLHAVLTLTQASEEFDEVVRDTLLWAPTHSVLWSILPDYPMYHAYALAVRPDITIAPVINLRHLSVVRPSVLAVKAFDAIYHQNARDYFALVERLYSQNDAAKIIATESLLNTRAHFSHRLSVEESLYQLTASANHVVADLAGEIFILKSGLPVNKYLEFIRRELKNKRLYIKSLGLYGHIHALPELMAFLDSPELARLSAASIYMITGASPEETGWSGAPMTPQTTPLSDHDGFPEQDPDSGLTWPDKKAFDAWWTQCRGDFTVNQRYLAGKRLSDKKSINALLFKESLQIACLAAVQLPDVAGLLPELLRLPAYAGPHALLLEYRGKENFAWR